MGERFEMLPKKIERPMAIHFPSAVERLLSLIPLE
jgi:hypothetical protein